MRESATGIPSSSTEQQQQQQQQQQIVVDGAVGGIGCGEAEIALISDERGSILIQDSLTDFTEQVKVNKNHYTLTYSGTGNIMMMTSAAKLKEGKCHVID